MDRILNLQTFKKKSITPVQPTTLCEESLNTPWRSQTIVLTETAKLHRYSRRMPRCFFFLLKEVSEILAGWDEKDTLETMDELLTDSALQLWEHPRVFIRTWEKFKSDFNQAYNET